MVKNLPSVEWHTPFSSIAYTLLRLDYMNTPLIFNMISELAASANNKISLVSLDLILNSFGAGGLTSIGRFFALSMPNLQDIFLSVRAWEDISTKPHLRAVFAPGRNIKRFVYHRARIEDLDEWGEERTDLLFLWDDEIHTLLVEANVRYFGICAHLPTLV
ncbi:hypothetical protein BDV12DRAFT_163025 [Aspergillus spectabilis]